MEFEHLPYEARAVIYKVITAASRAVNRDGKTEQGSIAMAVITALEETYQPHI
jgi:hypothetical protein